MTADLVTMNATDIMAALPHRYPFLLIDRIVACTAGESIVAVKNVTNNEPFFLGHFPGLPVMPGVLVIEAMAQAGGVLSHVTMIEVEPKPLFFLAGVDNARFRQTVVPGHQLRIEVRVEKIRRGIWFYECSAKVDDKLAVAASIMCAPGGER